ncbi:putative deoxycytidylate deaminase [Xanthomonas phage Xp15]|uniref:Putative deoxycytidylate deaminase n=1 Tax=Xanthomonas phage Xp15 TaxID=322855 RepID=Q52PP1_9CAUD|nr:putative deoxycytidylate deaminase [Xanthomonas phage Xp15]AAX84874.1 putative deoxycytidylate deaminase [Xanthomonas phage Xp15]
MMAMAMLAASRGTCKRRQVGCILVDDLNHVLATGYNGTPRNVAHCGSHICPGMNASSGTQLDGCMATHAEQNALLQCMDVEKIHTVYCTTQPCLTCTKLLMNTGAKWIVYLDAYPNSGRDLWLSSGRNMCTVSLQEKVQLQQLFHMLAERSDSALITSAK